VGASTSHNPKRPPRPVEGKTLPLPLLITHSTQTGHHYVILEEYRNKYKSSCTQLNNPDDVTAITPTSKMPKNLLL
jgi:hypothetical protein